MITQTLPNYNSTIWIAGNTAPDWYYNDFKVKMYGFESEEQIKNHKPPTDCISFVFPLGDITEKDNLIEKAEALVTEAWNPPAEVIEEETATN